MSIKLYNLDSDGGMSKLKHKMSMDLLNRVPVNRGTWQSLTTEGNEQLATFELANVVVEAPIPYTQRAAQRLTSPDLPWADEHFAERVGGEPLNPPPSHVNWPWHKGNEDKHIDEGVFSHTYPERMWPKNAGFAPGIGVNHGIRYHYGDLEGVVDQLKYNGWTRQAYLPIWFPEDTGSIDVRVPCTLGYHFIRNGAQLDVNYFLRSCDITRHFHNDVYFTLRLVQWIAERVREEGTPFPLLGTMTMFISNLHMFKGDSWRYQ